MPAPVFAERLRSGSSILALSAIALLGVSSGRSAIAQTTIYDGLYGGGSTLASLALRQAFDCYAGIVVGTGFATAIPGWDGYSYSTIFSPAVPTPSLLPTTCTSDPFWVEGLYAAVGSGAGLRGFIANRADQLFLGNPRNTITVGQTVFLPAVQPQFVDNNNVNATTFGQYPYPRIDFGASDSPLPNRIASLTTFTYNVTPSTNWVGAGTITVTRVDTTSTVAYNTASYGQPIQLPLFEAPLAIAVNVPVDGTSGWTVHSQFSATAPGGVIQLSTAQICAIFSGLVTDWGDTWTTIPNIGSTGTLGTQTFSDDNTYHAGGSLPGTGATAYVDSYYGSTPHPIVVVYRADGGGTSYILTNYLKTVCPILDPLDAYGYVSIFSNTSGNLSNNSFTQLIANISAVRGVNVTTPTYNAANPWVGVSGDNAAASAIGNAGNSPTTQIGRIGYVGNNFVKPYNGASTAPASASVQNDWDRANGVYHPGQSAGGVPKNFIAPTPAGASAAWAALQPNGVSPQTTWTYTDYNIYAKTFVFGAILVNSNPQKSIQGLPILPLANGANAYPLVGTSYLFLYSCYGDGADGVSADMRKLNIVDFLTIYYDTTSQNPDILANNGFHALPAAWGTNITNEYLTNSTARAINSIYDGNGRGCTNVTGGAQ